MPDHHAGDKLGDESDRKVIYGGPVAIVSRGAVKEPATLEERAKKIAEGDRLIADRHLKSRVLVTGSLLSVALIIFAVARTGYWLLFNGSKPTANEFIPTTDEIIWFIAAAVVTVLADSKRREIQDERLVRIELQLQALAGSIELLHESQRDYSS